jgi:hypothetical protein
MNYYLNIVSQAFTGYEINYLYIKLISPIIILPIIIVFSSWIERIYYALGITIHVLNTGERNYISGLEKTLSFSKYELGLYMNCIIATSICIYGFFYEAINLWFYPIQLTCWIILVMNSIKPSVKGIQELLSFNFQKNSLNPYYNDNIVNKRNILNMTESHIRREAILCYINYLRDIFGPHNANKTAFKANANYSRSCIKSNLNFNKTKSQLIMYYEKRLIMLFWFLFCFTILANAVVIKNLSSNEILLIKGGISEEVTFLQSLATSVGIFFANGIDGFQKNYVYYFILIMDYLSLFLALSCLATFLSTNIKHNIESAFFPIEEYVAELEDLIEYIVYMLERDEIDLMVTTLKKRFEWNDYILGFLKNFEEKNTGDTS